MSKTLYDVFSTEHTKDRMHRFGPDYYARQASCPAGAKTPTPTTTETKSLEDWLKLRKDESDTEDETIKSYEELSESMDIIDDESINSTPNQDRNNFNNFEEVERDGAEAEILSEMTSDSDLSYVNCYDVENAKVYKTPKFDRVEDDNNVEKVHVSVGEGKLIFPQEEEVKKSPDENANFLNEIDKHFSVVEAEIAAVRKDAAPKHFNRASTNFQSTHHLNKFNNNNRPILRRFKSESDLIVDDSWDRPVTVISKKKDNTLISKIYKDPNVKRVALQSRDYLPVEDEGNVNLRSPSAEPPSLLSPRVTPNFTNYSSEEDDAIAKTLQTTMSLSSLNEDLISMQSIKKNDHSETNPSENAATRERNIKESDPVLSELNKKKIVATLMKVFTETYPNPREDKPPAKQNIYEEVEEVDLTVYQAVPVIIENEQIININPVVNKPIKNELVEEESVNVSVRDLKKKFEKLDIEAEYSKKKPFHSLTARSISKSTQEKLRH